MTLSPGRRIGPYEIVNALGAGGMGEVYRAKDARLGRDVALKVLPADVARDPDRRARFEREARAVATLSHPNILAIHDIGTDADTLFVVTELLDGASRRGRRTAGRGHVQAIGATAHRLCRVIWKLLHDRVAYEEHGPAVTKHRAQRRAAKMVRELRALGYRVEQVSAPASSPV